MVRPSQLAGLVVTQALTVAMVMATPVPTQAANNDGLLLPGGMATRLIEIDVHDAALTSESLTLTLDVWESEEACGSPTLSVDRLNITNVPNDGLEKLTLDSGAVIDASWSFECRMNESGIADAQLLDFKIHRVDDLPIYRFIEVEFKQTWPVSIGKVAGAKSTDGTDGLIFVKRPDPSNQVRLGKLRSSNDGGCDSLPIRDTLRNDPVLIALFVLVGLVSLFCLCSIPLAYRYLRFIRRKARKSRRQQRRAARRARRQARKEEAITIGTAEPDEQEPLRDAPPYPYGASDEKRALMRAASSVNDDNEDDDNDNDDEASMEDDLAGFREAAGMVGDMIAAEDGRGGRRRMSSASQDTLPPYSGASYNEDGLPAYTSGDEVEDGR